MTPKEAIKVLKKNKPTTDTRMCGKELCAACDTAIEALEKQIPRKPINVKSVIWDLKYGECPICGSGLNDEMYFCSECGVRLDWSEE